MWVGVVRTCSGQCGEAQGAGSQLHLLPGFGLISKHGTFKGGFPRIGDPSIVPYIVGSLL